MSAEQENAQDPTRSWYLTVGLLMSFLVSALVPCLLMVFLDWPASSSGVPAILVCVIGASISVLQGKMWSKFGLWLTVAPVVVFVVLGVLAALFIVPKHLDMAGVIAGIGGMICWFVVIRLKQKKAPYPGV